MTSAGGIVLDVKVETYTGSMDWIFGTGNMVIGSNAELYSADTTTITSSLNSYKITGSDPMPIHADGDLTLNTEISVSGTSGILDLRSNGTVYIEDEIESNGVVSVIGNADCVGTGGVEIDGDIESNSITITGGSLNIGEKIEFGSGTPKFISSKCVTLINY